MSNSTLKSFLDRFLNSRDLLYLAELFPCDNNNSRNDLFLRILCFHITCFYGNFASIATEALIFNSDILGIMKFIFGTHVTRGDSDRWSSP